MVRNQDIASRSLYSMSPLKKRRRRRSLHTPSLRRGQFPRDAKPFPSIEESTQKGPFDPYAFLSQPSTPSLSSPPPNQSTALGICRSDVSSQDGKTLQSQLPSIPGSLASNDDANVVKREQFISFTPVIKQHPLAASAQNTQVRKRKLEENGVVELDRDEFALQRFLKVHGEMVDLEAILMKGKKRHVFEQIKRNAATNSLRGVEQRLAENDSTPTPSGRPTSLQEGTTSQMLVNEQYSAVTSKVVDRKTEISQGGPASTRDPPSTSKSGKDKMDRPQEQPRPDHGAIHPSRRHVFDQSEGSQSHTISQTALPAKPSKRKELPGMGLICNPRPNRPQDDRKLQDMKLPQDLQRREVNIPADKNTVEKSSDADIESAIDSAQDWLRRENVLEQEARTKRWVADPNWKRLTADQADVMKRQASIPPAKFYGHRSKWRPPQGWRQPPMIETTATTLAKVDEILARVKRDQASRLFQATKDKDRKLASPKLPHSNDGSERSQKPSEKKIHSSTSKHSPTTSTEDRHMPKATSMSREEKKAVEKAVRHGIDSQRSVRDERPAVESQVKATRDTVEASGPKALSKKRKRDTDTSATPITASTAKIISESPNLPSMKEVIESTLMAVTSSPARKKKSKKYYRTEAVEDVVNNTREPSPQSGSKKRKKAKENMEVHETAGEEAPTKRKKRKKPEQVQGSDEAVVGEPRSETFIDRLKRKKTMEKALILEEAIEGPSQSAIPTPEGDKTQKLNHAPPTVPEPAVEDLWQPTVDDDDPILPPQPSPSSRKKHKSKRHGQANTSITIDVNDTTPETIESTAPASPPNQPSRSAFNHHRRRHQSLPLRLNPHSTTASANLNTAPPQPPNIHPHPNFYDLNLRAIRNRLSNLEAAVAAAPAPPPNPNANILTPTAARKLRLPPLSRAVPHASRLSDARLIEIGKRVKSYERHRGAPYAFSWWGRLYAEYDYLLDRVDGWDYMEKSRVKR